jgi:hypothetical protein
MTCGQSTPRGGQSAINSFETEQNHSGLWMGFHNEDGQSGHDGRTVRLLTPFFGQKLGVSEWEVVINRGKPATCEADSPPRT